MISVLSTKLGMTAGDEGVEVEEDAQEEEEVLDGNEGDGEHEGEE